MSQLNFRRLARRTLALAAVAGTAAGCSLDLVNPNAPQEGEVLRDPELILNTAVGLQSQYADNILIFIRAPELATDQWGTRQIALQADQSLVRGDPDATFGVVSDPFAAAYRIARSARVLQVSAPLVNLSRGNQVGISALSKLLTASAIGYLTTQYEQLPASYDSLGARPLPRDQVRDTVIALLESARAELVTVSDAELAPFTARVLTPTAGAGIDLRNSVDAMLARYYLFDGRYAEALAAAGRVNRGSLSLLQYPSPGQNPVWQYFLSLNYVGARKEFFTDAQAGDARPTFWATRTGGNTGLPDSVFPMRVYGANRNDPYPFYLPDEMRLIQAEAYARQGNLAEARRLINEVRTEGRDATSGACTPSATEPRGCLPPLPEDALDTPAEVFAQILYERRYELFGQGLRWEDLRRLSQFTTERPSMQFLPYPQAECDRNPNAGC
ncbi:RagB/SusD family nutrient uptake outer membrane protein [Longimicrobium sp.]|uniref:RagB/SusD family nutrient uptake outer membrane protein n=1 Tax=Longimicrobium sp. TaxID=2029185 RepID=UPI002E311789|nr:RagB/SusD family nutrient uptake outer membrane protein [Longimicrobium sp.]HEX6036837.1 RagB/SusD family nutrient uptake outer membrane protein [Longimicrobium sp.]